MTEQWEYVDAHLTRQEREWEQLVKESKCWDCGHLKRPPSWAEMEAYWCDEILEYTTADEAACDCLDPSGIWAL
jgi:uncharacterized protein (DUF2236 family)